MYDAAWNLIVANAPYDALMGETSAWRGIERNGVWRNLVGPGGRAVHTPPSEPTSRAEASSPSLRLTAGAIPGRPARCAGSSASCARRARASSSCGRRPSCRPREDRSRHKIIDHPDVGRIALDCDVLIVAGDDLRIMVYTAEPGTEDAERLALAIVLGTQTLVR